MGMLVAKACFLTILRHTNIATNKVTGWGDMQRYGVGQIILFSQGGIVRCREGGERGKIGWEPQAPMLIRNCELTR